MTPSPIRPTFPRPAARSVRRTTLLAASALCGVAAMLAPPALAGTLPGIPSAANITVSTGGSQPLITFPDAVTLQIDLNAPRTVINWSSLHVSSGDSMNFLFDAASDIVLNKTTSQIAIDNGGVVTGKVGAATGGNIWFYSPQGVIVSPGAIMTAGGFLFSRGSGIVDAGFVDAGDPLANLRAATDALVRINTISSATSASIDASGDVLLSASSGGLNVAIAEGATVGVSTTSGSITVGEVTATTGAASVAAGGPGATITSITGATGVTVSSGANTSVGSATTTTSGDILLTSDAGAGSVSLTLGNSAQDLTLSANLVFTNTIDAARDVFVTGSTQATVTNRIFAGDDIEITAVGNVAAAGAYLKSTGLGASDDAHILLRSDTGSVAASNTLLTQGTGAQAGDITIQAATTASVGTANATRDLEITGATTSLVAGSAARDVFMTAATGDATVVTQAVAGDDVEVTAVSGAVLAGGATLRSTGLGAGGDAHVLARSMGAGVTIGSAVTEGTGAAAGDVILQASDTISGTSVRATRDISVTAPFGIDLTSATAGGDITLFATAGDAILRKAELTGSGAGHDLLVKADGVATLGALDYLSITAANTFGRTGGNTGVATVLSLTGDAGVHLDTAAAIDTVEGQGVDVTINSGPATFGAITAQNSLYVEALDGALTVGAATANTGDLELYADAGALTITGAVHGAGLVHLESDGFLDLTSTSAITSDGDLDLFGGDVTIAGSVHGVGQVDIQSDGLLDGTAASLISSDGDLQLAGATVDVGSLQADGMILAVAYDGNIDVQSALAGDVVQVGAIGASGDAFVDVAEAGAAVVVGAAGDVLVNSAKANGVGGIVVVQADGAATLRAAEATDGVMVAANGRATFGADSAALITVANYAVTGAVSGCGCTPPAPDGLQVYSDAGDAIVNVNAVSNPIGYVGAAAGDVSVTLKTGNLKIDEVRGYTITLEATAGALETGFTTSDGGDYTVTAQDFLGDVLTPTLSTGGIHDVTVTDILGDLNLGTFAIHAGRKLTITAQDGAVTGLAQLDAGTGAGDGEVTVTAEAIALDTVLSDGDVTLNGGTGLVDLATSVSVANTYRLTGGDFSNPALAPLGARAGSWSILDQAGDFDFSGNTLRYGGSISVVATQGDVVGGDMTSDTGDIHVEAEGGSLGALYAGGADVTAIGNLGGLAVGSADSVSRIMVTAANGVASLGSAVLRGTGVNTLTVQASNGDVVLGAATPGAITAASIVTSAGSSTTVVASTPTGRVDVNLDHTVNADLTTIDGPDGVAIKIVNGAQRIASARSTGGAVQIDGPTGALTVDQLTAAATSRVSGGGDTRLVSADVAGDLTVSSATGDLRFGDATPGRVIEVGGALWLNAHTDIAQQGALHANALGVTAGTGVVLLGANQVAYLDAVDVAVGGFAFHGVGAFDLYGPINAPGQTVDLRSDQAIGQVSTGVITARKLTGSSVGGASFGAANQVAELGDFANTGGGLLKLVDGRSLTIGGTVFSAGTVSLASHGGMAFAGAGAVQADGTGDAVLLAVDGALANARGADAVTAANGRWLIYTQAVGDPLGAASNAFNGLAGKSFYGSAYDFSAETLAVAPNAGNRFVYGYQPTLAFTPDSQVVTYNGTVPGLSSSVTGLVNGDLPTDAWAGALVISGATSKNVGTYILIADVSGLTSDLNYAFAGGTGSLRIDAKVLGGVLDADDRTYDGTVAATGSIRLSGVVSGDVVSAAGTYAFADKTAGADKTVTASGVVLSGADAANYDLGPLATATADIFRKALSGALTASARTYDGTVAAAGVIGLTGVVAGDVVTASGTYAFADRTAGTGKTVTASGVALAGGDAANYDLGPVSSTAADILKKTLTGSLAANDKTYDGAAAATGAIGLTGVVAGDAVSASGTYAFADGNAGTGKTVTVSGATLAGLDAANYDLGGVGADLADILRRSVTVAADNAFKPFGQADPPLTYRVTVGALVTGDSFVGGLAREVGEAPGVYGITRGALALSANYDLTFTGAVLTIQPLPSNDPDGSSALKSLARSPDFTLDWDPEPNLATEGRACPGEGCPPQAAASGGGKVVAALR